MKYFSHTDKYIRYILDSSSSVNDMFNILTSSDVKAIFIVFNIDKCQTRYPFKKPKDIKEFLSSFNNESSLNYSHIDSSNYNIYTAEYLDIYTNCSTEH